MEYKQWRDLSRKMAVKAIVHDLCDFKLQYDESLAYAEKLLKENNNTALDVEYRMGQALDAIESLGYMITSNDNL